MQLEKIYQPIAEELIAVEKVLKESVEDSPYKSTREISNYLFLNQGKGLRPAMMILAAKATASPHSPFVATELIKIASAVELIHTASLIHDDVIDRALLRHNKPTINSKYGQDVSIAFGDYLYSIAFRLISASRNMDVLSCIVDAARAMCEGELAQICERGNPELLKEHYLVIVKKKTSSLFAASCQAGAMVSNCQPGFRNDLNEYGLNFGIAFQIVDDCLDLISKEQATGKDVGCDFKMGELTLPLVNLFSDESTDREELADLLKKRNNKDAFFRLRERFIHSEAFRQTQDDVIFYINKARQNLSRLESSSFKESLLGLTDFVGDELKLAVE
jgi:geranylgeranyl pyrophosphate synthase